MKACFSCGEMIKDNITGYCPICYKPAVANSSTPMKKYVFKKAGILFEAWTVEDDKLIIHRKKGDEVYNLFQLSNFKHKLSKNGSVGQIEFKSGIYPGIVTYSSIDSDKANKALQYMISMSVDAKEFKKKCNVCGHIFCYKMSDIQNNVSNAKGAMLSGVAAVANVFGGTQVGVHGNLARGDKQLDKIVDYNKCPSCNSTNLSDVTDKEIANIQNSQQSTNISVADELKKFKELLDMGVISQEEFDAKKKQLLGL